MNERRRRSAGSERRDHRPKAPEKISWAVWFAAALGLTTAFLAFVALWEIVPLFGGWPGPPLLPLSGYYEALTFKNLTPGRDGRITPEHLAIAEQATREELKLAPLTVDAWLRLAYIDSVRNPTLSPMGLDALKNSFDAARYDPVNCGVRDVLALNHWPELTPELREETLDEIKLTWRPPVIAHQEVIEEWRSEVKNPAGRLALLFVIGPPKT